MIRIRPATTMGKATMAGVTSAAAMTMGKAITAVETMAAIKKD